MRLRVQNLGPLKEAELDLRKPLIVLTGPNNTGKTYLAWAVYSAMSARSLEPPPSVVDWTNRLLETPDLALTSDSLWALRQDVADALAAATLRSLPSDFAAPPRTFANTTLELLADERPEPNFGRGTAAIGIRGPERYLAMFMYTNSHFQASFRLLAHPHRPAEEISFSDLPNDARMNAVSALAKVAADRVAAAIQDTVREVIPVERIALNLFARELAASRSEMVDELLIDREAGEHTLENVPLYPRAIRDALQIAIRNPRTVTSSPYGDIADELEAGILEGSVEATERGVEFAPFGTDGVSLDLHQSASVVKALVSLVLFLRHRAVPETRVIIDEPELSLHPDKQRRVARSLAKAVNSELRVMMSTHSDYIVRELNNLIMLGESGSRGISVGADLGYPRESFLRREDVGVYFTGNGTSKPVEVTEEGFSVPTIDDEVQRLNYESQVLYQRLFEDE